MLCDNLEGWEVQKEWDIDIYIYIYGWTFYCTTETNTIIIVNNCCSPRGCKELDTTEQLHWTELRWLNRQRICLQSGRLRFDPWVEKIPWKEGLETHSSILAWRIPWTEDPARLLSIGSQRVGHGWNDWARMYALHNSSNILESLYLIFVPDKKSSGSKELIHISFMH